MPAAIAIKKERRVNAEKRKLAVKRLIYARETLVKRDMLIKNKLFKIQPKMMGGSLTRLKKVKIFDKVWLSMVSVKLESNCMLCMNDLHIPTKAVCHLISHAVCETCFPQILKQVCPYCNTASSIYNIESRRIISTKCCLNLL